MSPSTRRSGTPERAARPRTSRTTRRLVFTVLSTLTWALAVRPASSQDSGFDVTEASILELQAAMSEGRVTSADLVDAYLARIVAYDNAGPELNALLALNPNARLKAEELDRERATRGPRGPLHGIPVILKDNFDTADMPTTAGSIALAGYMPPDDAFQVRRLREAGAIILAKANLYEFALNWTTVSSLGGLTRNPYDPERTPGGSSGGTAASVAASFAAVGWGTDTCGSIRLPASHNGLFGLRPTKGLSSVDGIVPLAHTHDVGGPMARSATDLAIALDATVGVDPADPATLALVGREPLHFVASLDARALEGTRLGVLSNYFGDRDLDSDVAHVLHEALETISALGAELVEVEIPDLQQRLRGFSLERHEFKWDLMDYLAGNPGSPVTSLAQVLDRRLIHQDAIIQARRYEETPSRMTEAYRKALAIGPPLLSSTEGLLDNRNLDALVYPVVQRRPAPLGESQSGSTCALSVVTGLPALAIPVGLTYTGLPVGLELLGRRFDDARLVSLGFAFEEAENPRRSPPTTPPVTER